MSEGISGHTKADIEKTVKMMLESVEWKECKTMVVAIGLVADGKVHGVIASTPQDDEGGEALQVAVFALGDLLAKFSHEISN